MPCRRSFDLDLGHFLGRGRRFVNLLDLFIPQTARRHQHLAPRGADVGARLGRHDARRQPAAFHPYRATPFFGYGYQFWLHPSAERTFVMQGVHGQSILVQPASGIVIVQTAVYAGASGALDPDAYAERGSFWLGVLDSLGGSTRRW